MAGSGVKETSITMGYEQKTSKENLMRYWSEVVLSAKRQSRWTANESSVEYLA
jgi:hypothetical protein